MDKSFTEIKLFKVKPDKTAEFELLADKMQIEQERQKGCITIKYMKRFYTIDGVEPGNPPRKLTKIVKCVKYYSVWEFDSDINFGSAIAVFFKAYEKDLSKLLIEPFDINIGDSL